MKLKIAPSILSADFGNLNKEMADLEPYCDLFHVDVMDGHFVPNITIGAPVVKCLSTERPLDIHLMIENPERYVEDFVKAGGDRIIVHSEACKDLRGVLELIAKLGGEPAVSIKPATPVSEISGVLDLVEEVLVMTVEPGFGGQAFMGDMVSKISELREMGFKKDIGVDGGINAETGKICRDAGANLLVAGNFIFSLPSLEERVSALKSLES